MAAFTSTYTETTYTVTQTILTIVPAGTTTELGRWMHAILFWTPG